LGAALSPGRPGNPDDDDAWFNVDWMDTDEAQALLGFQTRTWEDTLRDVAAGVGRLRRVLPLVAPLVRPVLARRSAYRTTAPGPADPWSGIASLWGEQALVDPRDYAS